MDFPKSPLDQVPESYEREPLTVPNAENYPHPYQGHMPPPQNNPSDLGYAANILAALAHVPFCFIGLIMSIVILVAVRNSKLARFYAIQSLLLHGTLIVGYIVSIVVMIAGGSVDSPALSIVGTVLYITIIFGVIGSFLVSIVMSLLGKKLKIPLLGHLADRWSGPEPDLDPNSGIVR
jgi:uncharacterized membrane protein